MLLNLAPFPFLVFRGDKGCKHIIKVSFESPSLIRPFRCQTHSYVLYYRSVRGAIPFQAATDFDYQLPRPPLLPPLLL